MRWLLELKFTSLNTCSFKSENCCLFLDDTVFVLCDLEYSSVVKTARVIV